MNQTDLDVLIVCIYEVLYQLKFKIGSYSFPISSKPKTSFSFTSYSEDMITPQLNDELCKEADFMCVLPGISMEVSEQGRSGFVSYDISPYFVQIRIDSTVSDRSDVKRLTNASGKAYEIPKTSNESPYKPKRLDLSDPHQHRHDPKPQRSLQFESEDAAHSEELSQHHPERPEMRAEDPLSPKFYKTNSQKQKPTREYLDESREDFEEHRKLLRDADALINSSTDYQLQTKESNQHNKHRPAHDYREVYEPQIEHIRAPTPKSLDKYPRDAGRPAATIETSKEPSGNPQPRLAQRTNHSRKFEERFGEKSPYLKVQPDYKNPGRRSPQPPSSIEDWKENSQMTTKKKPEKRIDLAASRPQESAQRDSSKPQQLASRIREINTITN